MTDFSKSEILKLIDFNSYKNNNIIFSYSFLDNKNFAYSIYIIQKTKN